MRRSPVRKKLRHNTQLKIKKVISLFVYFCISSLFVYLLSLLLSLSYIFLYSDCKLPLYNGCRKAFISDHTCQFSALRMGSVDFLREFCEFFCSVKSRSKNRYWFGGMLSANIIYRLHNCMYGERRSRDVAKDLVIQLGMSFRTFLNHVFYY